MASTRRSRQLTAATLIEPSSPARHSGPPSAAEWMTGTPPLAPRPSPYPGRPTIRGPGPPLDTARSFMDDNRPAFIETISRSESALERLARGFRRDPALSAAVKSGWKVSLTRSRPRWTRRRIRPSCTRVVADRGQPAPAGSRAPQAVLALSPRSQGDYPQAVRCAARPPKLQLGLVVAVRGRGAATAGGVTRLAIT